MSFRNLLLAGLSFTAACATTGARTASIENGDARITGLSLENVGVGGATLVFAVDLRNRDARPRVLRRIEATLRSGGRALFSSAAEPATVVSANETTRVLYRLRVDYADVLARDRRLRPGVLLPFVAELEFALALGGTERTLSASMVGEAPIPVAPRIEIVEIAELRAEGDRIAGVLRTTFTNDNAFPIDGDRFVYSVNVEGRDTSALTLEGRPALLPAEKAVVDLRFSVDAAAFRANAVGGPTQVSVRVEGTFHAFSPYGVMLFAAGASGTVAVISRP